MTRGTVRRLGAAGLVTGCLIALPGQAGAEPAPPTIAIAAPAAQPTEGQVASFTITRSGTEEDLTLPSIVTVATSDNGSAVAGEDYTATTGTIIFAPGDASEPFDVPTTDDEFDEDNETFTVTVTVVENGTPGSTFAEGTIVDGDATPVVSISGAPSVTEGAPADFTVSITGKSENPVTVNYAGASGSATVGVDFTVQPPGQFTWGSGDTTARTINVSTVDDALDEENETYSVNLSGYSSIGSPGSATGTILDGDDAPTVVEVRDIEVTEDNTTANVIVRLSGPSAKNITIDFGPGEGGTANADDHVPPSGRLQIPAGATQGTIPVVIKEDTLFEGDETVFVNLFAHVNVAPGPDVQGKVTIKDDADPAAAPTVPNASATEGNSGLNDLTFQVTLAGPRPQTTFNYRTVPGTADDSDYQGGLAQITLPASSAASPPPVPLTIKVRGDTLDEISESFTLRLENPTTGAVVATATGTIVNDDNNTEITIADASVDEPSSGTATLKFNLSLSAASGRSVSVGWQTADGTAAAGTDYTTASGTVDFARGETTKVIEVTVIGDTVNEENETVLVNLTGSGARLVDTQAQGTIIDKNAPPSLSVSDTLARESEGAKFTVTLAGTTLRTVTVRFNTADGMAKAGTDYTARVGTLTFAPGEKTKIVEVTVLDDAAAEPTEDFSVNLGDAINGAITKSRGVASIEASDQLPFVPKPPTVTKPPVAKPAALLVPRMILGPRTVPVGVNGIARMLVTCQKLSPIGCAGTVELERAVKPLLKFGKKTFSVKKGTKGYASIKLTPRALSILRKNGTLRAKVIVLVKTSTKTMKVSPGIITLKSTKTKTKAPAKPKAPTTRVFVEP